MELQVDPQSEYKQIDQQEEIGHILLLVFTNLLFQTLQSFYQSGKRPFCSFDGCGIREANPFAAEGREECARDNGNSMIFGEISSERFRIRPAFGLDRISDVDEGVISLADD